MWIYELLIWRMSELTEKPFAVALAIALAASTKRSNSEKSIRLANVRLETSGQYKCEVSTEGPSFASFHKTANLTVIGTSEEE
ncbi:hypothetical protein HZH68_014090 [Vespula germanica]|uniref:Ig-like domain-containing protein n=1 Tax=Vespula germanica TaxID=30212 RepID=A0A834J9L7_VESGE|nr:hypothetical protein HZH68_014090 [Vespula germanica]